VTLRIRSESDREVVLEWDQMQSEGFVFTVDGKRVSSTFDGARVAVRFSKPDEKAHTYGVVPIDLTEPMQIVVPAPPAPPAPTTHEGRVKFCMYATSQADKYTLSPTPTAAQKAWMVQHWDRAIIYMDQIAAWHPGGWGYNDMLAIYTNSSVVTQHPDWILKDAAGNKLKFYSDVQYAGDIGNPAYRQFKVDQIKAMVAKGYKGLHADDVNLDRISVNGNPIDPRTGQPITLGNWRRYYAELMEAIRAACPSPFEIVHNSLWWADTNDQYVRRTILAADVFELERGFNDPNYSPSKIIELWTWINKVHSWGVGVNHLSETGGVLAATFNLACALMSSNGRDYVYGDGWRPDAWNPMYDKDLGDAKGPRYQISANVWRRDFTNGYVVADLAAKTGDIS
jgi:putative glycosyl hydrolase-like family 15 (GHL15) protein